MTYNMIYYLIVGILETDLEDINRVYALIPARFPRIEGASGNVSKYNTSKSSWLILRTV